ncbi:MAG: prolyl oligopeptidase family serine peptidase [Calditrichaeota bacterium]|nr:prolyl oligopeptidase family serine peptidase [Calditrichota bacterium]
MIKLILKYFALIFSLLLCVIFVWAIWEHNRNHLAALDFGINEIIETSNISSQDSIYGEPREYQEVNLSGSAGNIKIYISLPLIIPKEGLPVILILGGLQIRRSNFSLIENPGNNAIVIYKYPYDDSGWYDGTALLEIPKIRNAVLSVPAQVVEVVKWLKEESWCDRRRVSIAGYSFGALFTPAVYRLANKYSVQLSYGVIAYGGADIYLMLKANLKKNNFFTREIIALLASTAIFSVDPENHLHHLNNEFLVINGNQDKQIPEESWLLLHNLLPEPKTVLILDDGHMHPRKPELTTKLVNISRDWLTEKGVINH